MTTERASEARDLSGVPVELKDAFIAAELATPEGASRGNIGGYQRLRAEIRAALSPPVLRTRAEVEANIAAVARIYTRDLTYDQDTWNELERLCVEPTRDDPPAEPADEPLFHALCDVLGLVNRHEGGAEYASEGTVFRTIRELQAARDRELDRLAKSPAPAERGLTESEAGLLRVLEAHRPEGGWKVGTEVVLGPISAGLLNAVSDERRAQKQGGNAKPANPDKYPSHRAQGQGEARVVIGRELNADGSVAYHPAPPTELEHPSPFVTRMPTDPAEADPIPSRNGGCECEACEERQGNTKTKGAERGDATEQAGPAHSPVSATTSAPAGYIDLRTDATPEASAAFWRAQHDRIDTDRAKHRTACEEILEACNKLPRYVGPEHAALLYSDCRAALRKVGL